MLLHVSSTIFSSSGVNARLAKQYHVLLNVLLSMHLSIFLVINQLDAQNPFYNKFFVCFYMFRALFSHHQGSKLYYIASGIVTPVGVQVKRGRNSHLRMWRYQMMCNIILTSWWWAKQCSKHIQAYNKLIMKQDFVHQVG